MKKSPDVNGFLAQRYRFFVMVLSKSTNQIGVNFRTVLKPVATITAELLIILEIIEEIVLAACTFKPVGQRWKPSRSAKCDPPSITRPRQNALRKLQEAGKAMLHVDAIGRLSIEQG